MGQLRSRRWFGVRAARALPQPSETLGPLKQPDCIHFAQFRAGCGRPLFLVHAFFGDGLLLRSLAESLHAECPIYVLEIRGAAPREEPHGFISETADACIQAMRARQPSGPYAIAACSIGGLSPTRWLADCAR